MRTLIFALLVLLPVPAVRSQQAQPKETKPEPAPENSNSETGYSDAVKPGHPLDPADVDTLTGKKDREAEAGRRVLPYAVGGYGSYPGVYGINGQGIDTFDVPLLPLTRIAHPFYFYNIRPRSFGRTVGRGRLR